jgi:hypothetical protein
MSLNKLQCSNWFLTRRNQLQTPSISTWFMVQYQWELLQQIQSLLYSFQNYCTLRQVTGKLYGCYTSKLTPLGSRVYSLRMKEVLPPWKLKAKASRQIWISHTHTNDLASRMSVITTVTVLNGVYISLD